MTTTQAGRIFISYRRDDSAGYAGRIYDRLATHFGKDAIFMDVDTIQAGLDFVEVLENAVQSCDVLVALIGRQWLSIKDLAGKRRLDNPEDFVRIEVAAALKRGIRVIPVLVDGTPMPNSDQLPGNLVSLARRNAVLVSHHSFHNDASRLIEQLELALESAEDSKIRKANELKEREARTKHQTEIENLLSQADIALNLQDWELAKDKLDAVLKLESGHGQAQVKLAIVERKLREIKEQNLAKEKVAREKADRESAKKAAEERQVKARIEAERLAALKAEEERLAHEKIESERKAKEDAEKLHSARIEREAAEREAAQRAEREVRELAARKKAEREAAENVDRESAGLAARRKAEREAGGGIAVKDSKVLRPSWFTPGIIATGLITFILIGYGITKSLSAASGSGRATLTTQPPATQAPTQVPIQAPVETVTVAWWHTTTDENNKAVWQKLADEYMTAHPNVTIEITVMEYQEFQDKITAAIEAGDPPDIFQSWGGNVMNQYIEIGMMKDITADLDADGGTWRNSFSPGALGVYSLDGRNYGVPWDMGTIGFWYNKDLFAEAGIEAPPATWDELLAVVVGLKAAGITPIALGEGDKWPGQFWFGNLATRICGQAGFHRAADRSGSFSDPCFVEAANKLVELNALEPFQNGYLGATYGDQETSMGNGQAAMELMGPWAPSVQASTTADGKGLGDKLGFFPFPAVDDGAGAATDTFGGGNGFGIGKNAEPEAVDFVKWLTTADAQIACAKAGFCYPVVKGSEAGLSDPLLIAVQGTIINTQYIQLYYDQALPPAVGSVVNDSVQGLFAGTLTPEQAAQAIEDSAEQELK